jgi:hypothetical protein
MSRATTKKVLGYVLVTLAVAAAIWVFRFVSQPALWGG